MANVIGGFSTSHIPAIGNAISKKVFDDPYWKPFFDAYPPVHEWIADEKPDIAVVIYNDHGLNFFLDKMPTFSIGAATEYHNKDEGWGLQPVEPFPGDPGLSWHIIETAVEDEFEVTTCQEMYVDHAFAVPMSLFWPDRAGDDQVKTVPIVVNTVQHPLPSPSRCFRFGQSIGRALASYPDDEKIVVIGTGGLSHQLDGTRAGFINKEFDEMCMDKIVGAPEELAKYSTHELIELAGAQGVELINWLVMRGALTGDVSLAHANYHIPISNTAAGLMVLNNQA
jgi:protocatechuate 4,5-dioxygenase beta chain